MSSVFVPTAMIPSVWGDASKILENAVRLDDGYALGDVYIDLLSGRSFLWIYIKDSAIAACMVVAFENYPRKRTCRIRYIAGKHMNEFIDDFSLFESWAQAGGADDIELVGRKGWCKILGKLNFSGGDIVMNKKLRQYHE